MKVIIDIPDDKRGASFLKRARHLSYVQTAKKMTTREAEIFKELEEIKKAFSLAEKVKSGKIKGRPASELLDEL